MGPAEFVRQMAYWAAFFDTSGDLPIAGCRATAEEWATIETLAIVTGGGCIHRRRPQSLHRLPRNC
jgi:hypothetical protein